MRRVFCFLHKASMNWIHANVLHFSVVFVKIPHALLVKARLSDLNLVLPHMVNLMRTSTLNQLHRPFKRCVISRRQNHVQMIRHDDKFVE
jgi:hypothetical protein